MTTGQTFCHYTCLPNIEEIETELGRIGEEESGALNVKC